MLSDSLSVVRWQFSMTWALADFHLSRLTDAVCLWLPAESSWTVHLKDDGRWLADWAEPEPESPAAPSIAWLTWHVMWWWSGALQAAKGQPRLAPTDVTWAGSADAAVRNLRNLAAQWDELLDRLSTAELEQPVAFPWPEPRPLIYTMAWVNSELMKNVAEIGELVNVYGTLVSPSPGRG
ncbi:DinB family protein [Luteimicrobium sp. NPDC057192]|uniref:DinB family protein n=1 Tax=Luteimicrobium sp. NPDC057192 TaxID=3346042 RepID=UPI0036266B06